MSRSPGGNAKTLTGALAQAADRAQTRLDIEVDAELREVLALSDFLVRRADFDGAWFFDFVERRGYARPIDGAEIAAGLDTALSDVVDLDGLQQRLRVMRNRFMVQLVWRHVSGRAGLTETTAVLSSMADAVIGRALGLIHDWAVRRHGIPVAAQGHEAQRLVVLALGKLGAEELNLSSDVDLMFAYPEVGQTEGGTSNQQFFVEVCQQLVQAVDTVTGDGFAFRVDTRLRPYGESGALVLSFGAMEDYYAEQGRSWERYALIKLRPCAGDIARGRDLAAALRPFVYRRYLDFGAVGALREMKARVNRERAGQSMSRHLKLGPGGIRDIEFVVQLQQLIWGGRFNALQDSRLHVVLERLGDLQLLSRAEVSSLADAYEFLRDAEHTLQAIGDAQTHVLPTSALDRERLAWIARVPSYDAFVQRLDSHRRAVSSCFDRAIGTDASPEIRSTPLPRNAQRWLERLERARDKPDVQREGKQRVDKLIPRLVACIDALGLDQELALSRVVPVLEAVLRRSAYLVLLIENPGALAQFVQLTAGSAWIAARTARHPILLDEMLVTVETRDVPHVAELRKALQDLLHASRAEGQERALDILREFKEAHVFRVAAAELNGDLPLMRVSDYLTFVAEAIVAEALVLAWEATFSSAGPERFAVIAYGKLGGLELGPGSDLDLVLLHDFGLDAQRDLQRLVRRFLLILSAHTRQGQLYEVDMRLRPDGNSGMMVSTVGGFERYQMQTAWTFEHQALVRARPVAGDEALGAAFMRVRRNILGQSRDMHALKRDIVAMRRRIAASGPNSAEVDTDVKRGPGGIVDIEFLVQYLVLASAHRHGELTEFTDNVRILEVLGGLGLLAADDAAALTEAYLALRSEWHTSVLDGPNAARAAGVLQRYQGPITEIWSKILDA
ncbi:MAG: bifunctional glutamine synthetase adenylyltransferase/deadenyltransferase [Gammaproteobacteria bacterium]|nr:bifunctional glutamine synthetase adenylyltransferase/deadenyltransferase [Gammaproteobacteria bacterium]